MADADHHQEHGLAARAFGPYFPEMRKENSYWKLRPNGTSTNMHTETTPTSTASSVQEMA